MLNEQLVILNKEGDRVAIASNRLPGALPYFDDVHTEVIETNQSAFELSFPGNHPDAFLLEVQGSIIRTDLDNKRDQYIIKEIVDKNDDSGKTRQVYCEHASIDDLNGEPVMPTKLNSYNLEQALGYALTNTGWEVGTVDFLGIQDIVIEDIQSSREAILKIVEAFGGELSFEITYEGGRVSRKLVHVVEQRGSKTNKIFDYTKDLISIERREDTTALVTALVGIGQADESGNRLDFTNLSVVPPAPFIKQGNYIENTEAFQLFGNNGKNIKGYLVDSEATNATELFNNTLAELTERSRPKLTYSCAVVALEHLIGYEGDKVRIGDTVLVRDFSYEKPIVFEARIVELKRSLTAPEADSVVFGDFRTIIITESAQIAKLERTILTNKAKWDQIGESIIKQDDPPANPGVNTLWMKTNVLPNVIYRWDGFGWIETAPQVLTEDWNMISDTVGEINQRTTPEEMIRVVLTSSDAEGIFNQKADIEDLSQLSTNEQLEAVKQAVIDYTNGRLDGEDGVNAAITLARSEFEKTALSIDARFSAVGGDNLIRNSIGYASLDFWTLTGSMSTLPSQELEQLGYGSGFYSALEKSGYIEQTVPTQANGQYTISFLLKKTTDALTDANAGVEVYANGTKITDLIGVPTAQGVTNGYEMFVQTFNTEYSEVTIRVTADANAEATITGLALDVGDRALRWTQHHEEIANTNIQMNLNGIKVINAQTGGYTIMSPQEFSGYAEVVNPATGIVEMKRVFTLNGDVTEVDKLSAEKEISMGRMKVITIDSGSYSGWGFIGS